MDTETIYSLTLALYTLIVFLTMGTPAGAIVGALGWCWIAASLIFRKELGPWGLFG